MGEQRWKQLQNGDAKRLAYHIENCRHNGVYEPWRDRLNAAYFLRAQPTSPIQLLDVWVRLAADHGAEALRPGNFTMPEGHLQVDD